MSWRDKTRYLCPIAASHPLWGILAEGDDGELYVPLGRVNGEPYWLGRLNLKNPFHWLPFIRSRLTRTVAWIELETHHAAP